VRVEVRLFATLTRFRPGGHDGEGVLLDVPEGVRLADIPRRLGIPATMPYIAVVNGREVRPEHSLAAGDVIALFPPLSGGET